MAKIWEWLNGNKTVIGTVILVVTPLLLGDHTFAYQILMWAGGLLTGGGIVHKFVKPANANS